MKERQKLVLSSRSFGNINFLWSSFGDIKKFFESEFLLRLSSSDSPESDFFLLISNFCIDSIIYFIFSYKHFFLIIDKSGIYCNYYRLYFLNNFWN